MNANNGASTLLIDKLHEAIFVLSEQGIILYCNKAASELYGQPSAELIGLEFTCPTSLQTPATLEIPIPGKGSITIELYMDKVVWNGDPAWLVSVHDISDLVKKKNQLNVLANVFNFAKEGIIITDASGNIIDVNAEFERITGYKKSDVLGKNPRFLHSGKQDAFFYKKMWADIGNLGYWFGEIWNRRANGEAYPQLMALSVVHDEHGDVVNYVAVFYDISELVAQKSLVKKMASYDLVTELPNQAHFMERLHQVLGGYGELLPKGRVCAIAVFALVGGSEFDGKSLKVIAGRFKMGLHKQFMLSHFDNGNFALFMPNLLSTDQVVYHVESVFEAFTQPLRLGRKLIHVQLKAGISFVNTPSVLAQDLINQAEHALYQARISELRNWVVFDQAVDSRTRQLELLRAEIAHGLAQNQFQLLVQPKINLMTNDVVGVEGLLRWDHPEKGVLPPAAFLPAVDGHELQVDLSDYVLTQALSILSNDDGICAPLSLSVNINPYEFKRGDFIERLEALIHSYPREVYSRLELEVLESNSMDDINQLNAIFNRCHEHGMQCGLDDFGTGYSTLSYLTQVKFDYIKVDGSIVMPMLTDPVNRSIIRAILEMSHACGFDVIAEGVESDDHIDVLSKMGCDMAQGYAIARPMPVSDFTAWYQRYRES